MILARTELATANDFCDSRNVGRDETLKSGEVFEVVGSGAARVFNGISKPGRLQSSRNSAPQVVIQFAQCGRQRSHIGLKLRDALHRVNEVTSHGVLALNEKPDPIAMLGVKE